MNESLSFIFRDKKGRDIHSQSSKLPMIPASNMKIVTGLISSFLLGENFEILTEFRISGDKLIVSGGPSPLLRTPEVETIREQLGKYNVTRVMFNGSFDWNEYAPKWAPEDQNECYQSRISSFSLNENCIPRTKKIRVTKTYDPHSERGVSDIRPYDTLSKKLLRDSADNIFPSFEFTTFSKGKLVYVHKEKIGDILEHLEPISCNFSADSLYKFIHHFRTGLPGSWKGGSETIMEEIGKLGLSEPDLFVVDGSGLSSLNKLTPSFLSRLMRFAVEHDGGKFLEYLPSPGTGTLEKRLGEFRHYGIKAKTGSLTGVATLSGYIKKLDITFSIMLNNTGKKGKAASDVVDETLGEGIDRIEKLRK